MNKNQIINGVELSNKISDAISDYISESVGNASHDTIIETVIDLLNYHAINAERLKNFQEKIDREAN